MPGFLGLTAFYSLSLFTFSGIWVPRWSLSRGFDSVLNDVIATGCDHCFVQVFALGESYCPSRYAPYHNLFSSDELRRFLQNAHRHNIKVHAWFNLFYIASYNNPPVDPGHPFNCRPDWFVWDYHGQSILGFSASEIKRLGLEGYYLAPANYWVREYLKSIILEVITNFDFDGVHLDYVRYPSKEFTLDPATRARFARITYVDPFEIINNDAALIRHFGSQGLSDLYRRWFQFLCDDLSSFIYELNLNIKKVRPALYLSAAVKPDPIQASREYYQDWVTWINREYIDFVCLMAYTKNLSPILNGVEKVVYYPERVMVGLGLYLQSPEELRRQIDLLNNYSFGGVVFFSYEEIRKDRDFLAVIR